jgi:hypothetical protein
MLNLLYFPCRYRPADGFPAVAVGLAGSSGEGALSMLRNMAELYGKIGE